MQKAYLLMKNTGEFSRKKARSMDQLHKTDKTESKRRQKNWRGDRKEESNDSPEIPGRRVTSEIPSLPSGDLVVETAYSTHSHHWKTNPPHVLKDNPKIGSKVSNNLCGNTSVSPSFTHTHTPKKKITARVTNFSFRSPPAQT